MAAAGVKSLSLNTFLRRVFLMYGCSALFLYSLMYGRSSKCSGYLSNRNTLHGTLLVVKSEQYDYFECNFCTDFIIFILLTLRRCPNSCSARPAYRFFGSLRDCPKCSSFCHRLRRSRRSHSHRRLVC